MKDIYINNEDQECLVHQPHYHFLLRQKIANFENDLTTGQDTEKALQANLNHIKDNQLLSRNQHKARLDKRMTLFRSLKVRAVIQIIHSF